MHKTAYEMLRSLVGSEMCIRDRQIDPPEHKNYRRVLDPIFAPRQMALLDDSVRILVNRLIDRFIERGTCELVTELTVPFPSEVFLTMLGLPLEHLPRFLSLIHI